MADDVTQEVFVQLWRHPDQFDPTKGALRNFLVMVAYRKAVDAARSESSRRSRERRDDRSQGPPAPGAVDAGLLEREESDWIAEAVRRLPQPEQDAVSVAFFGGYTYREAAKLLGQSEGTTKTRIRSGLHRLAVTLAHSAVDVGRSVPIR